MIDSHTTLSDPVWDAGRSVHRIAVLGAGTMGAGIAQLALQSGFQTTLYDPAPHALDRGRDRIADGLQRMAKRGAINADAIADLLANCALVSELAATADSDLVIEAAPESLELKLELFASASAVVGEHCVLATNTSSFSVTEIAAVATHPEQVVGMHFFNPAPVMRLLEVVAGDRSAPAAIATARTVGESMGKRVIDAADIAGFLINRCNRPFSLEALRLLEQQIASVEQIDRIARMEGGFRMGPFELMDLIGIETNHAVAESMQRQSFGEPRYRPSPLAARKIAARTLGRKSGQGWYTYPAPDSGDADLGPEPAARENGPRLVITGTLPVAGELRALAASAGYRVVEETDGEGDAPWLVVDCGEDEDEDVWPDAPRALLLHRGSLHATRPEAVGFHVVPPLDQVRLLEVTKTLVTDIRALERLGELAETLGWRTEEVADAPGLVLGRIVAQLINEAAFLQQEHNATADDIDAGMTLGVNHPRGPIEWSSRMGLDHTLAILDALHRELGEERYRVSPALRQRQALGA